MTRPGSGTASPLSPEQMLAQAKPLLRKGAEPERMLQVAGRWVEKWARLAERVENGEHLDGRSSIYTGETYAEARDRWIAYRELLLEELRGSHGGPC